jgi:hypothetical protein
MCSRHANSALSPLSQLRLLCSLIAGEMTVAKAMALAHEAALLCMIFPMQPVAGDTSFSFPDTSVIFRSRVVCASSCFFFISLLSEPSAAALRQ